jgi:hypothetical protein
VRVEDGMPLDDWIAGSVGMCSLHDGATRLIKRGTFDTFLSGFARLPPAATGPSDNRTFRVAIQSSQHAANVVVGDLAGCRAGNGGITFSVDSSENCTFADITLYGGPSIGYLDVGASALGKRGGNTYRNISIRYPDPPPGARYKPLLSTSADGFNAGRGKLGPTLVGAYFEGIHDDAVAVHGALSAVLEANASAQTVVIASQYGNSMYLPGEHVAFFDSVLFTPLPPLRPPDYQHATFRIVGIQTAPANYTAPFPASLTMPQQTFVTGVTLYQVLTLDAPPPAGLGFDGAVINADRIPSGFRVVNNTFVNVRGRGMLIKAHDGVIAGNTMVNVTAGGIIITPELNWREGDYSRNLLVADNVMRSVAHSAHTFGGIAVGAIAPDKHLARLTGHVNISVLRNVLEDVGFGPLWVSSAANIRVVNNTILQPFMPPFGACCEPIAAGAAFYATNVTLLTLSGNCVQRGNGSALAQLAVVNPSVVLSPQSASASSGVVECNSANPSTPAPSPSSESSAAISASYTSTPATGASGTAVPPTTRASTSMSASAAPLAASALASPRTGGQIPSATQPALAAATSVATPTAQAAAAGVAGVAGAAESPALSASGGASVPVGAGTEPPPAASPSLETIATAAGVAGASFVAVLAGVLLVRRWATRPRRVFVRSPLGALAYTAGVSGSGGLDVVQGVSPLTRPPARRSGAAHGGAV